MEELFGFVERITYINAESGFVVAKLQAPRKKDLITIVGTLTTLQPGESVRLKGNWKQNVHHGLQFEALSYDRTYPSDVLGLQKYLESGWIKGIGPAYAKRIVDQFGIETLKIIDKEPMRLLEIPGLGEKRVEQIAKCWQEQKAVRQVMLFLQKYEVSPALAHRIYKAWGDESIAKLQNDPFQIARDIFGIGFKTADALAQKMGLPLHSDARIEALIEHILSELSNDGHVCCPKDDLLQKAQEALQVDKPLIESALMRLEEEKRISKASLAEHEKEFYWLKVLRICEEGIARELQRLKKATCQLRPIDTEKALEWVQTILRLRLAPHQKQAVALALTGKCLIITGGPGTGKSTITKAILAILCKLTPRIALAAPTGRAAKRMTEITGHVAKTLHSLLEWDFSKGGFRRNRDYPIMADLIIVDESSMIDTRLMYSLLKAVPSHARIIFIGDIHQLPSVGPGNVLKDMIASQTLAVATLRHIFRQAAGSKIITNAHAINDGYFPDIQGGSQSDFFFLQEEDAALAAATITDLVAARLPKKYGFDRIKEIQVLCPMKKGPLGTLRLSHLLQEALNPDQRAVFHQGQKFSVGDKVMQIRNNYDKEVFNGDIGIISQVRPHEQIVEVAFEKQIVEYEVFELDELMLAYAVSIHKYQGSECHCIVIPVHTCHFTMLHRNLLYTGVTRGRKLVVLVGTKKALAIAVKNAQVEKRHTGLKQMLIDYVGEPASLR